MLEDWPLSNFFLKHRESLPYWITLYFYPIERRCTCSLVPFPFQTECEQTEWCTVPDGSGGSFHAWYLACVRTSDGNGFQNKRLSMIKLLIIKDIRCHLCIIEAHLDSHNNRGVVDFCIAPLAEKKLIVNHQVSLANANTIKVMMLHNSAQSNAGFREGTLVLKSFGRQKAGCGSWLWM